MPWLQNVICTHSPLSDRGLFSPEAWKGRMRWFFGQSSWVPTTVPCSRVTPVRLQVIPGVKQGMTLVGSFSEREKPSQGRGPDKAVLCGVRYPRDSHNRFISDLVLQLLSSSRGIDGQLEEGVPEKDPCSASSFSNQCALWRRHMQALRMAL